MDGWSIDPEHVAFAAEGRALIVGGVHESGAPHATRGWGFRVEAGLPIVILDADDVDGAACLTPGRRIAVSAADVRTFQSVQFKGVVVSVSEVTEADHAAVEHYLAEFYDAVVEVDGVRRDLVERVTPSRYSACRFEPREVYDQTPGPGAGAAVPRRA
jgi:hypothetical protein